jgi:hypothetical protein
MWHLPSIKPGRDETSQSDRIICQVAKNKPVELLDRGADERNRLTVSVGKISRMAWRMMAWRMMTWRMMTWRMMTWLMVIWLMMIWLMKRGLA